MTANVEKELKALRTQLAALSASLDARAPAQAATPKAKAALWETVETRTFKGKGAVGREVAHARFGGRAFVVVAKTINGRRVRAIAIPAGDLKAALADFDL